MQNLLILLFATYLLDAISLWRLFELGGEKAYKAFIPVYNRYIELKLCERPKWWVVILFIPVVSTLFHFALHADFLRCFGKRKFIDGLLVFLTLGLYVTYVNYDKKTKWVGVEERKETFIASIIFAIIFATAVHLFIAQPFIIPTSSMENTLRRGDALIVNKIAYGMRFPMTPIAFPFLQNKIPTTGKRPGDQVDSYLDFARIPYFRFPGYEKIKNNSLVVFNYPTDSLHTAIDRKDPYVKRCVAIPGDTLEIKNSVLYINGKPEQLPADAERQFSYFVETDGAQLSPKQLEESVGYVSKMYPTGRAEYEVSNVTDSSIVSLKDVTYNNRSLIDSVAPYNNNYKLYSKNRLEQLLIYKDSIPQLKGTNIQLIRQIPMYYFEGLSDKMIAEMKDKLPVTRFNKSIEPKGVSSKQYFYALSDTKKERPLLDSTNTIFPEDKNWNRDNYGPIYMPKKGDKITLNSENLTQFYNIINHYEDNNVEISNQKLFLDGKEVATYDYTIQKDYYFMMGDNRHMSLDSRFFGYVPFDHVMGKPSFWWMSIQGPWDEGSTKIRWNRMFKVPNNGVPIENKFNWGWIIIPAIGLFFYWDDKRRKKKKKEKKNRR